jgi:hypothetical protein
MNTLAEYEAPALALMAPSTVSTKGKKYGVGFLNSPKKIWRGTMFDSSVSAR